MNNFLGPIFGGILIGLSATLLLLMTGRIAGISGILWGAVTQNTSNERAWRWVFLIGILLGTFMFHTFTGQAVPAVNPNYPLAAVAGLFVGIGVKIGNGCTSGHGVCGIGRLSPRSLVATIIFMLIAIYTVAVFNRVFSAGVSP